MGYLSHFTRNGHTVVYCEHQVGSIGPSFDTEDANWVRALHSILLMHRVHFAAGDEDKYFDRGVSGWEEHGTPFLHFDRTHFADLEALENYPLKRRSFEKPRESLEGDGQ